MSASLSFEVRRSFRLLLRLSPSVCLPIPLIHCSDGHPTSLSLSLFLSAFDDAASSVVALFTSPSIAAAQLLLWL